MSIKYSECVSLALGNQHGMRGAFRLPFHYFIKPCIHFVIIECNSIGVHAP